MKVAFSALFFLSIFASAAPGQAAASATPACGEQEFMKDKYSPTRKADRFTGDSSISSAEIDLGESGGDRFSATVYHAKSEHVAFNAILISLVGKEWMFIEKGTSLLMLLDGSALLNLETLTSPKTDIFESGSVYESASYQLTDDQIDRLAHAGTIEMRVVGSKRDKDLSVSRDGLCALARLNAELKRKA